MHGVSLPRDQLSSLNYLHESSRIGPIPASAHLGRVAKMGRFTRSWHVGLARGLGPDVHDQNNLKKSKNNGVPAFASHPNGGAWQSWHQRTTARQRS